jgi:hypothetical protein
MTTIINGSSPSVTFSDGTLQTTAYPSTQTFGYKNRFINGAMQIAQRTTSATVTAGTAVPTASTGYPCVDRWFVYSTGANITAAQVAGSGNNKNNLQITGAASVTAVGVGQRIEQLNSYDLAGQTCTLSVNISNSLLTTVTWTASYATTADTFGTIGTPTKTQIATGTFTVTSTLTQYSAQISVPAAATTGIEILFTVGAQTSGTWVVGNAQLEIGSLASTFDTRDSGTELARCQRYYSKSAQTGTAAADGNTYNTDCVYQMNATNSTTVLITSFFSFPQNMRTIPTFIPYRSNLSSTNGQWGYYSGSWNGGATSATSLTDKGFTIQITGTYSVNNAYTIAGGWAASAEL